MTDIKIEEDDCDCLACLSDWDSEPDPEDDD